MTFRQNQKSGITGNGKNINWALSETPEVLGNALAMSEIILPSVLEKHKFLHICHKIVLLINKVPVVMASRGQ